MNRAHRVRLCVMMFLEFFIWGGWFVTMGSYLAANLHASGAQIALAYSTQSWGAIIAPFIFGLIADRYFNAERRARRAPPRGRRAAVRAVSRRQFRGVLPLLLAYMILYMPTLALVNAVAFRQLADPARHFSTIRVWGTIGWIVAGLVISYRVRLGFGAGLAGGALRNTFCMCAVASFALGLYSFTLPRPRRAAARRARPRRAAGPGCTGAAAPPQLRGVLRLLHPHLHSAGLLLSERQPVSHRDPRRQRHRQADDRPDVRSAVHAADPGVPAPLRHEDDAAGGHAGLGGAATSCSRSAMRTTWPVC